MRHTPRLWKPPVTDQDQDRDRLAQQLEQQQTERARWRVETAEQRRRLLQAGPALRNIDAALDCPCSCHPTLSGLHGGGIDCGCQLTSDELRARRDRLGQTLGSLLAQTQAEHDDADSEISDEQRARRRTDELGANFRAYGGYAPLVFRGSVDGHGFALRLRHDAWTVIVAGTQRPDADVWIDAQDDDLVIAEGFENELWDAEQQWPSPERVVETTIAAVRRWLVGPCSHEQAEPGDNYCRRCGEPVTVSFGGTQPQFDPARWRQLTDHAGSIHVWIDQDTPTARIVPRDGSDWVAVPVSGRELTVEDTARLEQAIVRLAARHER